MYPTRKKMTNRTPRLGVRSQQPTSYNTGFKNQRGSSASIKLDRFKKNFKKKFGDSSATDIAQKVSSEIGWKGLILLAICLIGVCYVAILSISSSKINNNNNNNNNRNKHIPINSDPEGWPDGSREDEEYYNENINNENINNENINNNNNKQEYESNWAEVWDYIKDYDVYNSNIGALTSDVLEERSHQIKMSFLHAWHGYAKYAMGHDEIQPIKDLPGDSWGGLGATLIDALDTMMLMGLKEELKLARDNLETKHFDIDLKVSFFETTIRHLGGLLGAYEMSVLLGEEDELYLNKAIELGNHLLAAFNTVQGIPKSMVNLKSGEISNYGWTRDRSILSEVGSNQLEFFVLSHFTSNPKYYTKSKHVLRLLNDMNKPDHGLYGRLIETDKAQFPRNERIYSIGGMADSFYEYLLKIWIVTQYEDTEALGMYIESIDSINEYLLRIIYDKNKREEGYFFFGEQWYNKFKGQTEELTCFMPGLLALGSYHSLIREKQSIKYNIELSRPEKMLIERRDAHLKLAHHLIESCVQLYLTHPTNLAPESITFNEGSNGGWNIKESKYQLRPETLESLYILYSITNNELYRQWAWKIYEGIEKYCKTDIAYSGIKNVNDINTEKDNKMESYVLAETFKYLYLLFNDNAGGLIPLNSFVFNTEAHIIRTFPVELDKWMENENNNLNNNEEIQEEEEEEEQQQQQQKQEEEQQNIESQGEEEYFEQEENEMNEVPQINNEQEEIEDNIPNIDINDNINNDMKNYNENQQQNQQNEQNEQNERNEQILKKKQQRNQQKIEPKIIPKQNSNNKGKKQTVSKPPNNKVNKQNKQNKQNINEKQQNKKANNKNIKNKNKKKNKNKLNRKREN